MARLILLLLVLAQPAAAEPASYQEIQAERALQLLGYERHPDPEGRRVAFVHIARYPVFIEEEPFPTFPNYLHWLTHDDVVRREVLLRRDDRYRQALVDESARNLRGLEIFSVVATVPVRAREPDAVGLLVVTRDLWSLRLETNFQFTENDLDLSLLLTERNLFGRGKRVSLRYGLSTFDHTAGASYYDRRFTGEPLSLQLVGDVLINREDGSADGFVGRVVLARPFFDLQQDWGFRASATTDVRTVRIPQGGEVLQYCTGEVAGDTCVGGVRIPATWEQALWSVSGVVQRQIGGPFVQRVGAGIAFSGIEVEADLARYAEADADAFREALLPDSRRSVYPLVSWTGFQDRFRTFQDLAAFGVNEDVRLGFAAFAEIGAPLRGFGSTYSGMLPSGFLTWTDDFAGDGLYELAVGADARLEDGDWPTRRILARGRLASPRFLLGRAVLRADWVGRGGDQSDRVPVPLGGGNGLRGYGSEAFVGLGGDRLRTNAELRSPPLVLSYLHAGLVAFWDAGAIYDTADGQIRRSDGTTEPDDFTLRQAVGLGLRVLLPQFNRTVFRLDVGVPLEGQGFTVAFSGGSSQAVPLPGLDDAQFEESSVGGLLNQP